MVPYIYNPIYSVVVPVQPGQKVTKIPCQCWLVGHGDLVPIIPGVNKRSIGRRIKVEAGLAKMQDPI
jgi:hypothetical protein